MDGAQLDRQNMPGFKPRFSAVHLRVTGLAVLIALIAAASPAAAQSATSDAIAWSIVRDAADPLVLQRFIDAYPTSPFVEQARARLSALAPGAGFTPPLQPRAQSAVPQQSGSETPAEPRPRGATEARQIVRSVPAKPAIGAEALSPQPLAKSANQLGGSASHYQGYLPAPRKVPTTAIPAPALPGEKLPGAPVVGASNALVLAKTPAHLLLQTSGSVEILRAQSEAVWRQTENTDEVRVFRIDTDFAGMGWAIAYELRIARRTPQEALVTLRVTLDYRGRETAPSIEKMLPVGMYDRIAGENKPLFGTARQVTERVFEVSFSDSAEHSRNLRAIAGGDWMTVSFILKDGSTLATVVAKTGDADVSVKRALAWAAHVNQPK